MTEPVKTTAGMQLFSVTSHFPFCCHLERQSCFFAITSQIQFSPDSLGNKILVNINPTRSADWFIQAAEFTFEISLVKYINNPAVAQTCTISNATPPVTTPRISLDLTGVRGSGDNIWAADSELHDREYCPAIASHWLVNANYLSDWKDITFKKILCELLWEGVSRRV